LLKVYAILPYAIFQLEIARIQKKILDIISTLDEGVNLEAKMAKNSAIANLNSTLFNMTQVFEKKNPNNSLNGILIFSFLAVYRVRRTI
jgi:hypothetical protein